MSEPQHAESSAPRIRAFPLGETETNAYLVSGAAGDPKGCWIVDPGVDPSSLVETVRREGLEPRAIVLTHAHYDHIGGVDEVERAFGRLPIHLHAAEEAFCEEPMLNLSVFLGTPIVCRSPDHTLAEGSTLSLGESRWRVMHTPGHSPGSVCLVDDVHDVAIVGDLVFAGSIGRTDFPTSDPEAMRGSLARILEELPDSTALLPGHGPATTLAAERRRNPFLQPAALR
ncbi:MAG: MBL fold metallo-hydrolase [Phycisphaerales bacterium]|jgi:hydroxyacylglutathione hydrolase